MTITIGGFDFMCTHVDLKRELRRTDIRYNTQGDMLIDLVRRKYRLEVTFGLLTSLEIEALRANCEQIFVKVGFDSPEGRLVREFHVMNEPAPIITTVNDVNLYGGVKIVFMEK
ncbi:MAG: hypothetical protein J1F28_03600 [Oscillospiraceae bacterium]|nr:hypothetical protein [Oscillospiraceae bacterium]